MHLIPHQPARRGGGGRGRRFIADDEFPLNCSAISSYNGDTSTVLSPPPSPPLGAFFLVFSQRFLGKGTCGFGQFQSMLPGGDYTVRYINGMVWNDFIADNFGLFYSFWTRIPSKLLETFRSCMSIVDVSLWKDSGLGEGRIAYSGNLTEGQECKKVHHALTYDDVPLKLLNLSRKAQLVDHPAVAHLWNSYHVEIFKISWDSTFKQELALILVRQYL